MSNHISGQLAHSLALQDMEAEGIRPIKGRVEKAVLEELPEDELFDRRPRTIEPLVYSLELNYKAERVEPYGLAKQMKYEHWMTMLEIFLA